MQERQFCPRCGCKKLWHIRRGRLRCSDCRYEWGPASHLPLYLTCNQWSQLLHWFFHDHNLTAKAIAQKTGLERKRILRALLYVRLAMFQDLPVKRNLEGEIYVGISLEEEEDDELYDYFSQTLYKKRWIREDKWHLFEAEYKWRFMHRNESIQTQEKLLLEELEDLVEHGIY